MVRMCKSSQQNRPIRVMWKLNPQRSHPVLHQIAHFVVHIVDSPVSNVLLDTISLHCKNEAVACLKTVFVPT